MRFLHSLTPALALLASGAAHAASSWSFDEASVSVSGKTKEADKQSLSSKSILSKPITLEGKDNLKIRITAKENGKAKRPHQAFVILTETKSGLEAPFPLTLKENGKGVVDIAQKDLPVQFLLAESPLRASIVIGSFGAAQAVQAPLFDLAVKLDANAAQPKIEKPVRYGKKPEIHHIFRDDPKNPPKVVSLFFAIAVLAALPLLLIAWLGLGANVSHLQKALGAAPISHATFFGSLVAMEGVFFMYYRSWTLFQTLPAIGVVGTAAFLSGTRALGEVQNRRVAGER